MVRRPILLILLISALAWLPPAAPGAQAQGQPLTLQPVGFAPTADPLRAIEVRGEHAYVVGWPMTRLDVYSIANPAAPQLVGSHSEPFTITDMLIAGDYLYLSAEQQALRVLSLADPARPQPVDPPAQAGGLGLGLAYARGYLFVALGPDGVRAYSLANPARPQAAGAIDWRNSAPSLRWSPYDVIVDGGRLYVSAWNGRSFIYRKLFVVDIGNPAAPAAMAQREWRIDLITLAGARGGYGYQSGYPGDFEAIDLRNPEAITSTGELTGTGMLETIDWAGGYAYAAGADGVLALDVADPAAPALAGSALAGNGSRDLAVRGRYVYVAAWDGLRILTNGLALDRRVFLPAVRAPQAGG